MNIFTKHSLSFFFLIPLFFAWYPTFSQDNSGGSELKSIEEVIEGIDSLLGDIRDNSNQPSSSPIMPNYPRVQEPIYNTPAENSDSGSFRVQNELMPDILLNDKVGPTPTPLFEEPLNLDDINPPEQKPQSLTSSLPAEKPRSLQPVIPFNAVDYRSASLEELLREVELLDLPTMEASLSSPMPSIATAPAQPLSNRPREELGQATVIESPLLNKQEDKRDPIILEDYTVLGESIDFELRERIREAIMETRRASGGSDNPYVTRSVFKATSYCNRVLGRLNAPHHKRYRRDVLLSLILSLIHISEPTRPY